jgi:type IV pilus assembly protein PilB
MVQGRKEDDLLRLTHHLIKAGSIEELQLADSLSKQYGVPAINLRAFDIDPETIKLVPKEVCEKYTVIPVTSAGFSLVVAMSDPSNVFATDDLKFLTGYNIDVVVTSEAQILDAISRYY